MSHPGLQGAARRHDEEVAAVLGTVLVLTDRTLTHGRPLATVVDGAPTVVLREKDLPDAQRAGLATELRPRVGTLLAASDATLPGIDGVHLAADDPWPRNRPALVGRSCHDLDEVARAADEGCDYVTLSPIYPSPSKPGYGPPLDTAAVTAAARFPLAVYALGGIHAGRAGACLAAGATGVAVMGEVMRAARPADTLRTLQEATR